MEGSLRRRISRSCGRPGFLGKKGGVRFRRRGYGSRFLFGFVLVVVQSFLSVGVLVGASVAAFAQEETAKLCILRVGPLIDLQTFTHMVVSMFLKWVPARLWLFGFLGILREGYFHHCRFHFSQVDEYDNMICRFLLRQKVDCSSILLNYFFSMNSFTPVQLTILQEIWVCSSTRLLKTFRFLINHIDKSQKEVQYCIDRPQNDTKFM